MSFTSKNLNHSARSGISFLKGATFFFLGMSIVMFMTQAFQIVPIARNTIQVIEKILLVQDGNYGGSTGIYLDGVSGNAFFAGTVTGSKFCLSGGNCVDSWSSGGGDSVWNTGASNKIYYNSGYVGIGIDNPATILHISGSTGNPNDNAIRFQTRGFIQIGNSTKIEVSGTGVGIGGITPSTSLDVFGTGLFRNTLCLNNTTDCISAWSEVGGGGAGTPGGDAGNIQFNGGGTSFSGTNNLHWDSTNNRLGIGTNSPQAKLDVVGAGRFTESLSVTDVFFTSKGLGFTGLVMSPGAEIRGGVIGGDLHLRGGYNAMGTNGNVILANGRGNVGIGTATPEAKLHVNGTGLFNGNVGIGVTNPGHKLHVAGTGIFDGRLGIGTSSPEAKLHVDGTGAFSNAVIFGIGTAARPPFIKNNSSELSFYTQISLGAFERMRIDASGNVGIGTDDPQAKLHLSGGDMMINTLQKILFGFGDIQNQKNSEIYEDTDLYIKGPVRGTTAGRNVYIDGGSGTNSVGKVILANDGGNVGIGVTTPQAKLHVDGGIKLIMRNSNPCGTDGYTKGTIFYSETHTYFCFCATDTTANALHTPMTAGSCNF